MLIGCWLLLKQIQELCNYPSGANVPNITSDDAAAIEIFFMLAPF